MTPGVQRELKPWIAPRSNHFLSKLLDPTDSPAKLLDLHSWNDLEKCAYLHYMTLLHHRKCAMDFAEATVSAKLQRPLTAGDESAVRAWIQSNLGERGYLLAKKGREDVGPDNKINNTDEELVVVALMLALKTGRETFILTRDEDIFDQFYKMHYLLDGHYRSYLIANEYASNPAQFRKVPLPTTTLSREFFVDGTAEFAIRDKDLPTKVLPATYMPVNIHCHFVGTLHTWMTFRAEREMLAVLLTKGFTNGLNTRRLGRRNCHLYYPNLGPLTTAENGFILAEDRFVPIPESPQRIPVIELSQAMYPGENHQDVVEEPAPNADS